ncbi:unnamed protein product [Candidula unifasciata]|uniref:Uncharacterized protein n=1 Tax=Candidula unifasciata TaxID=100452 RepID=A0A8S3ZS74_9EUPU|nr:unnamed protein product [Candidula unifasciata]
MQFVSWKFTSCWAMYTGIPVCFMEMYFLLGHVHRYPCLFHGNVFLVGPCTQVSLFVSWKCTSCWAMYTGIPVCFDKWLGQICGSLFKNVYVNPLCLDNPLCP